MKRRKKIDIALDAALEEMKSAPADELPALIKSIIDLYKLITSPLRILFYSLIASFTLMITYLLIRIVI